MTRREEEGTGMIITLVFYAIAIHTAFEYSWWICIALADVAAELSMILGSIRSRIKYGVIKREE